MPTIDRTETQYRFIEYVLAFEGTVSNRQLRDHFDVSNVQASRILSAYRQAHPDNIEKIRGHGAGGGLYGITPMFSAAHADIELANYLETVSKDNAYPVERVNSDFTRIDPKQYRAIYNAIKNNGSLLVTYRSMSSPNGKERVIHPRTLVFAGRRWHVRAFDESSSQYRDFNLARFSSIAISQSIIIPPVDSSWDEKVQLLLEAHPDLSEPQKRLIRDELFEGAAGRYVTTRRALVPYVINDLEIAEDRAVHFPPKFQVHLKRIETVY
jgi:predicted DNA-binding transcriptional regulator YafY